MEVLLLLGGNIGDVGATMKRAEAMLEQRVGGILSKSRDHWTEPWGFNDERTFLNRALIIRSGHSPEALLRECLSIEHELGRTRSDAPGYVARTIDIDLLLAGDGIISLPGLVIPHPRLHQRAFALAPAADVAPGWVHPGLERSVLNLLNDVLRAA